MHLFTIKDLFLYNQPCIGCGAKTDFRWAIFGEENRRSTVPFELAPNGSLRFPLQIRYGSRLSVSVDPTTNAYQVITEPANLDLFSSFISTHHIRCRISCSKCQSEILSENLSFEEDHIAPVGLSIETLFLKEDGRFFTLSTTFGEEGMTSLATTIDTTDGRDYLNMDLPLMPRYQFKDRAHLLSRIKMCLLFG